MIKKEIEGKQLKQVLHFRLSFEPIFSEVDKSLFLAPPLRTKSCNVHYSGPILYDNERETWSKSTMQGTILLGLNLVFASETSESICCLADCEIGRLGPISKDLNTLKCLSKPQVQKHQIQYPWNVVAMVLPLTSI